MAGRYVCANCEQEGVITYLNDIVFEGERNSHGICRKHFDETMKAFDAIKEHNKGVSKSKSVTIQRKGEYPVKKVN